MFRGKAKRLPNSPAAGAPSFDHGFEPHFSPNRKLLKFVRHRLLVIGTAILMAMLTPGSGCSGDGPANGRAAADCDRPYRGLLQGTIVLIL